MSELMAWQLDNGMARGVGIVATRNLAALALKSRNNIYHHAEHREANQCNRRALVAK